MIASTFFDLVIGVDMHFEMVPTPAPVPVPFPHPFMGMVFDPGGLITGLLISNAIGMIAGAPPTGPVLVNFIPATNTGTDVKNKMVLPHFVIPPGTMWTPMPKAPKPKIGKHAAPAPDLPVAPAGDAVLMMGSKTVALMGSNAVRLGDLAMSCSEPVRLPSSVVLAIPKGPPVLMGGPPAIDWQQAIGALLRSKWVSNHLHGLVSRIKNQRWRNFFHKAVCFLTGHPVDVATGRLLTWNTDFELPGPLPLKFERNYASSWSDRDSVLGFGWSHSLDQAVWLERGKVVYRAEDGREIEFDTFDFPDHAMRKGDSCYDPFNRLTLRSLEQLRWEIETADGLVHEFAPVHGDSRKGHARLIKQRTRDGHTIQLAYDDKGCLEWVTDSAGRRILFAHDAQGRLTRIALPHPREQKWVTHARYVYSAEGDLVEVHDALGNVARWAYEGHLLVKETDRTGLSFYFGYDGVGSDASCIRTWGDGGIYDHEIVYDKQNHVTVVTNSLGHTTTYFANEMNAVVKVLDPLGGETKYEYDELLRKTAEIDPLGNETRYEYDARGNCTKTVGPDGTIVSVEYNAWGCPVRIVDALKGEWRWSYNEAGKLTEQVNSLGERQRFEYEQNVLKAVITPDGERFVVERDSQKNVSAVTFPNGTTIRSRFDSLGRILTKKGPPTGEIHYRYDELGRVIEVRRSDGTVCHYSYDAEGNPLSAQDTSRTFRWSYTGFHKLECEEVGGDAVRFEYDTEGQLIKVVNAAGGAHRLSYDACGRLAEEQGFDGAKHSYYRNSVGRLVRWVRPSGSFSEYTHDPRGRVLQIGHSDGEKLKFYYRIDGTLIEACRTTADGEVASTRFEGDLLGRTIREWQEVVPATGEAQSCQLTYKHDTRGLRTGVASSLGAREAFVRDASGRVSSIVLWKASKPYQFEIKRDASGLEAERALPSGVRVRWKRGAMGRPQAREVWHRSHRLDERQYHWSESGLLTKVEDSSQGSTIYRHDARGRLASAQLPDGRVQHRTLDAVGNVFKTPDGSDRRYTNGGRLEEADSVRFVYDADGRLVEKRLPDGRSWKYLYSVAGELKQVVRPEGERISFTYDAFGRRILKKSSRQRTGFVWDGDVILHEVPSRLGEADAAVPLAPITWAFSPDSHAPLAKFEQDQWYGVAADHLGTPSALHDEEGHRVWQQRLDLYGNPVPEEALGQQGGAVSCPFRWPGQYEDEETGLYYNRYRYYDPSTGCYLSQDPIGLLGGLHPYAYVDDPLTSTDPLGLTKCTPEDMEAAIDDATKRIPGLTREQAKVIFSQAFSRESSVVFGGSRVRGNFKPGSDIDIGFGGLTTSQADKVLKKAHAVPGGLPVEQTRIVPGNATQNIPKIESPEEFFMRSGVRSDPGREGEKFVPSGYVAYSPDGSITQMSADGVLTQIKPPTPR